MIKLSTKKLFLSIITLLLVIVSIIVIRKIIIINSINVKIDNYMSATNYYFREYFYQGWNSNTTEIWIKNNNAVKKSNNELSTIIQNNTIYDIFDNKITSSDTNKNAVDMWLSSTWNSINSIKNNVLNIKNIFKYSLTTAVVNGKNCYKFANKSNIIYIEKETGLLVRYEQLEGLISGDYHKDIQSTITDYKFIFNTVKDSDVLFDISKLGN